MVPFVNFWLSKSKKNGVNVPYQNDNDKKQRERSDVLTMHYMRNKSYDEHGKPYDNVLYIKLAELAGFPMIRTS